MKIVYILSDISKSLAFEWIADRLDKKEFDLKFILISSSPDTPIQQELTNRGIEIAYINYRSKKDLISCFFQIKKVLKAWRPDVVHAHLFEASLLGLLAAKILGVKKRIYTRHHSSLHHEYFPRAVVYDRIINFCSTQIVSISEKVSELLIEVEKVPSKKVKRIYHGFPFNEFKEVETERVVHLKEKYELSADPIIGVISRFISWKGIQYILPAFSQLLQQYPKAILVLANAKGPYTEELKVIIEQLEIPEENIRKIPFENDIAALYKCFDVFVHTPLNDKIEAFGQTYIEALLTKTPMVCTLSGIANEIIDKRNAVVVPYRDSNSIENAILDLLESPKKVEELKLGMSETDLSAFQLDKYISELEKLYRLYS